MERLAQDLRYALRSLARAPGFAAAAVLTLALGIGAATALFSAVDALLLRPLPLHRPERLVEVAPRSGQEFFVTSFNHPQYLALRESRLLSGLAAEIGYEAHLRGTDAVETVPTRLVSDDYFDLLGVRPALGRFFAPGEAAAGGPQVAVLSHDLWRRRFGSDPGVLGREVALTGRTFTVVGVAPRGFARERVGGAAPALWLPLGAYALFEGPAALGAGRYAISLVGRLREGATREAAAAELSALAARPELDGASGLSLSGVELRRLDPVAHGMRERVVGYLALLSAATALVLLIASTNVAGLLLARSLARRPELGIRMAIGASRARLVRQLLTEGMLLFLLGGGGGVLLALWLVDAVAAFPWPVPLSLELAVDGRVLGFALLTALVAGVGAGLVPALGATRRARLPVVRESAGRQRSRLRSTLVVLQIALSVLLLVGAGLFVRALQRAWDVDPGFRPDGVVVASLDLSSGYDPAVVRRVPLQLLERARALPGVESASLATAAPFGSAQMGLSIEPEGVDLPPGQPFLFAAFNAVTPGYFRTLGIPLLRGRALTGADAEEGPRAAVITRAMAEEYWPGEDPIGKRLDDDDEPLRVIGVVGDIRTGSLADEPQPMLFLPYGQRALPRAALHLRVRGPAAPVMAALRAEMRGLGPDLPPLAFAPLTGLIGGTLLPQRVGAALVGAFGAFGLLLALLGLHGVLAFGVLRRTREIGIRVALGADRREVVALVLRQGAALALAGIALGLAAALAATRAIRALLYGLSPLDPLTYAAVALLLLGVALLASWLPAHRAARVDPAVALRAE